MDPIEIVHAHAEGEVGDVIVAGVPAPPGETLWEQRTWLQKDGRLHRFLLNEPRGGVFRHANLLVPPVQPDARAGFIIMEPADLPAMSGSNTICVATVLLETGIVPMTEPETVLTLEAPGGLIRVTARCRNGKAEAIRLTNLPAFARALDRPLEVEGQGTLAVDTAWGGDSFVMVDAAALGFELTPDEARDLAELGSRITAAASEQIGFAHPALDWTHISFCAFCGPLAQETGALATTHAVAIRPGKIDRSPTGTAVSARMAVLRARNRMAAGDRLIARSLIGGRFTGRIEAETTLGGIPAIVPSVEGRGWISGRSTLTLDPGDPWPEGYRLSDTWPGA